MIWGNEKVYILSFKSNHFSRIGSAVNLVWLTVFNKSINKDGNPVIWPQVLE